MQHNKTHPPISMNEDVFSIITIVKDDESGLQKTLNTIFSQTYPHIQSIVIDGLSQKSPAPIIAQFPLIDTFVSEKDGGIYDAMNKGVTYAKGKWTLFLNAGDGFANAHVLKHVHTFLSSSQDIAMLCGTSEEVFHSQTIIRNTHPLSDMPIHMPACHQSLFIPTSLIKKYPFDNNFRICGDLDQLARIFSQEKIAPHYITFPIATIEGEGISNTLWTHAMKEQRIIQKKYYPSSHHARRLTRSHRKILLKKIVRAILPLRITLMIRKMIHSTHHAV